MGGYHHGGGGAYGGVGSRPGIGYRPGPGIGHYPGVGYRPGIGHYPGVGYGRPIYSLGYGGYYPYSSFYSPFFWSDYSGYSTIGGYDPYYAPYSYSTPSNVTVLTMPPAQPSTTIYMSDDVSRRPAPPAQDNKQLPTRSWGYLIAGKDGTVWLAREYSIRGDSLQIVTTTGDKKTIPLTAVDRALTEQLNRERGISVQLP